MLLTNDQRNAIDKLAAKFFEKDDYIIAVSTAMEAVIWRRHNLVVERDGLNTFDSKPELKSERNR